MEPWYYLLHVTTLYLTLHCGAEFSQLLPNGSHIDQTSVSLFFFGVHSTSIPFDTGSNILFNCEYSVPPGAEVAYIGIGKYSDSANFLYELLCGRDMAGRPFYIYNRTSRMRSEDTEKLRLVYIDQSAPLRCNSISKQRGSVMFELRGVNEDDVGEFYCKVHLTNDKGNSYKYSNTLTNQKCPEDAHELCSSYDSDKLKTCSLSCEHSCHLLGTGWRCMCYAGYKLSDDLISCLYDSDIDVYYYET